MPLFMMIVAALSGAWLDALNTALPIRVRPPSPPESTAHVLRTASFAQADLTESSGVAASRHYAGLLWSHNDSHRGPWLFATDSLGRDLGAFEVVGADNVDWEDVALAPCGPGRGSCVYIADTGDNDERCSSVTLYRVPEPALGGALRTRGRRPPAVTQPVEALRFRYPDGPHDVEAMYVDEQGDAFLITKGRGRPVLLFRLPATAWQAGTPVVAEEMGPLPIERDRPLGGWVTGAALSPDGKTVAVRTYRDIYLLPRMPDGSLQGGAARPACSVLGLEPQGEGIDWEDDRTLVLTSERGFGSPGLVSIVRCGGGALPERRSPAKQP